MKVGRHRVPDWAAALRGEAMNASAALQLLAWDTGVSTGDYVGALRQLCARSAPLYVASDSRAAAHALMSVCPRGAIVDGGQARNVHTHGRHAHSLDGPLLDWLALAEAGKVRRDHTVTPRHLT